MLTFDRQPGDCGTCQLTDGRLIYLRRGIPFLNIRLPEFWPFAARNDGLFVRATAGDADVLRQEKPEYGARLGS